MIYHLNPFARVEHNQWRLPRVAFHAAHVAIGLPVWLLARWVAMPLGWVLLAGTVLAVLDKCVWFNWRGRRIDGGRSAPSSVSPRSLVKSVQSCGAVMSKPVHSSGSRCPSTTCSAW